MNSTDTLKAKSTKPNSHIKHLVGKSMNELRIMFPDTKFCDFKTCDFNDLDHAISMEYEQHNIDMQKHGTIKIMYRMDDAFKLTKIFEWYNGKKWVELKQ